jgi:hypothetical protein
VAHNPKVGVGAVAFSPAQVGVELQAVGLAVERVLFLAAQLRAEALTMLAAGHRIITPAEAVVAGALLAEAAAQAARLLT